MCGICGVVQVGGEARAVLAPGVLDRMTDVMSHRGPDDRGTYEAAGVALGARRLSIVDVAGGHQPVRNEDGSVWAAQNGELYNHLELHPAAGARTGIGSRAAATPRSCRTCTSARASATRSGCGASSRSRSGTGSGAGRCSPATGSGSSRSTGRSAATSSSSPRS